VYKNDFLLLINHDSREGINISPAILLTTTSLMFVRGT
jgi:hypothetical protein